MAEKVAWTMKGWKMIFKTSVWKEVNLCIGAFKRRAQVPQCILWRVALILEALTEKEARDDDALLAFGENKNSLCDVLVWLERARFEYAKL
jgi:hypothetical protein